MLPGTCSIDEPSKTPAMGLEMNRWYHKEVNGDEEMMQPEFHPYTTSQCTGNSS